MNEYIDGISYRIVNAKNSEVIFRVIYIPCYYFYLEGNGFDEMFTDTFLYHFTSGRFPLKCDVFEQCGLIGRRFYLDEDDKYANESIIGVDENFEESVHEVREEIINLDKYILDEDNSYYIIKADYENVDGVIKEDETRYLEFNKREMRMYGNGEYEQPTTSESISKDEIANIIQNLLNQIEKLKQALEVNP